MSEVYLPTRDDWVAWMTIIAGVPVVYGMLRWGYLKFKRAKARTIAASEKYIMVLDFNRASFVSDLQTFENMILAIMAGSFTNEPVALTIKYPEIEEIISKLKTATPVRKVELTETLSYLDQHRLHLQESVSILLSRPFLEIWGVFIRDKRDWIQSVHGMLEFFRPLGSKKTGTKFDIWRTEAPELMGGIYLNDDEVKALMITKKVNDVSHLAMGAGWIGIDELPYSVMIREVIPRMAVTVVQASPKIPIEQVGAVIMPYRWHVGLG